MKKKDWIICYGSTIIFFTISAWMVLDEKSKTRVYYKAYQEAHYRAVMSNSYLWESVEEFEETDIDKYFKYGEKASETMTWDAVNILNKYQY